MFYFREILFRIQYIFISFFITLIICYYNRDLLFFLLTFNFLLPTTKNYASQSGVEYLIYTHPSELLLTYITLISYFTLIISSYHFIWNVLDFMRSSLKSSQFISLDKGVFKIIIVFCSLNIYFLLFLFPSCWNFFESFNESPNIDTTLKFFLELKVTDYISFFKSLIYTTNLSLILILILWVFLHNQTFRKLLHWKKLYLFFNFVFATICAPPDVVCQVFDILVLNTLMELVVLTRIFKLKSKKQIKLLSIKKITF